MLNRSLLWKQIMRRRLWGQDQRQGQERTTTTRRRRRRKAMGCPIHLFRHERDVHALFSGTTRDVHCGIRIWVKLATEGAPSCLKYCWDWNRNNNKFVWRWPIVYKPIVNCLKAKYQLFEDKKYLFFLLSFQWLVLASRRATLGHLDFNWPTKKFV